MTLLRGIRRRRLAVSLLALLLLVSSASLIARLVAQDPPTPAEMLAEGDKMFEEKSWRQAQTAYRKYLESGAKADRERVSINLSLSSWRLAEFDHALAVQSATMEEYKGTRTEVIVGRQRMLMRLTMPSYYYEKDDVKYWGRWVQQATYHDCSAENLADAFAAGRRAHELWTEKFASIEKPTLDDLELLAQLKLELASLVESDDAQNGWEEKTIRVELPDGKVEEYQDRVATWPHKAEVIKLYDEAEALFARSANLGADRETVLHGGLAIFRKAMFFCHMAQMGQFNFGPGGPGADDRVRTTLPVVDNPLPVLREVITKYPDSRRAPEAWYTIATIYRQLGEYVRCLEELKKLREVYPKSKWVSDAMGVEQSITMPRMETSAQTSVAPGEVLKFSVNSRNVKEIQYVAHAFDLAALMNDAAFLADAAVHVDNLDSLQKGGYVERFRGEEIGKWSVDTKDDGTHQWYANGEVVANVKADRLGAFIVTATAGNITSMSLHVRSDRVAVVRPEPTGVVFWLVDRETGEPMDQGKWRYKEYFSWWINRQTFTATTTQQMTGDDAGVCRRALTVPGNLPPQARTRGVTAFAVSADGHMALTNTANPRSWFSDWNPHTRWLTWTERPVYRPGQDVHFKGIIRNYSAGDYSNVAGRELQWEAVDPRNQKVSSGTFTTSPVGTFNASLTLGARPTLGWYRVRVKQPASRGWEQQFTFRVEEYKKPEFEVSIESGSDRIKLGKDGQAKVAVKYYSGEPVSGAKASWRVYHEIVWNRFRFQRDYDWFYGQYLYEDQERGWGRDVVANGETECDANGEFTITFPTTHAAENWPDYKHRYSIEVEATDESRRVINGAGSVLVTKRAVEVFVDTKRGLYAPGDKVEFELHAETPAGKPVALDGKLHIGRLDVYWTTEKDKDGNEIRVRKRDEKWFTSLDVKTDAEGRGFAFFTMDSAGQFCVKFEATDPDGEACTDTHDLLVAGEGDALPDVRFSDLQIVPDQRVHSVGQTARVALTAVEPGTTILYRVETGADEAPCEVHQLNGAALIFNIPITKRLQPNYFITAIAIRHGAMQQARMEMFVLPVEKLLDVSVEANAEEFLPGSEGNLKLTVKDHDGKVVEGAEAAIAVVDASLYSIAPDNTPDPRTYYWQRRRSLGWNVYTSLTFNSSGYRADTNEYRTYENHGFAEGWSLSYGGWIHHDWQMRSRNLSGPAPEMGYKPVSKESARHGEQFMKPATRGGDADSGGFANRALFGTARFKNLDSLEEQLSGGMRSFGGEGGGRGGQPGNSWGDGGPDAENAPMDHNAEPDAPSGGAAHDGKAGQPAQQGGPGGGPAPMANPTVRTEFKDLALWAAQLTTSADGTVGTKVQWPDNLTRWKVNCVIVDSQSRMGYATISLRTTKNVKVRLQAPRFFVETDEVVLTAVVQNDLKVAKDVRVKLAISEQLELLPGGTAEVTLRLPAHGRDRVDWRVKVVKAGIAKVRMDALTDVESDAQEMTFPAYIHGATKHHIVTGRIDAGNPQSEAEVSFTLPAGIDATRTKLRVSVTPSVVNTALDALPYLIDYPYGCVEQTMSRFMPAVAVRKTLADLGVNLEDVAKRRNNINLSAWPVEAQVEYRSSAVFNQARLNDIIAVGLARIYDFQMADGGFGWWKGGNSDIYMTAYVLQGLLVARQAEVKIDENVLARGLAFLSANFSKVEDLHRAAYISHVLAMAHHDGVLNANIRKELGAYVSKVYDKREHLSVYTRSLLLMTLHWLERTDESQVVYRNLIGYIHEDDSNATSWFGQPGESGWWYWHNDRIEQNAWAIRALNAVKPDDALTHRIVKWLVNNRKGNRWHSTRATAFAIVALAEHAKLHKELNAEYVLDVELDGKVLRSVSVTPETMFALDGDIFLTADEVTPGAHTLRLVRKGVGAAYFTADLEYFATDERITAAGSEISVERKYYVVTEKLEKQPDGRTIQTWDRRELKDGEELASGQLLDVELRVDAKNDYEYLCFEDWKPACCEALNARSGYSWQRGIGVYTEYRDEMVVSFVGRMQQGYVKIGYRLRCETPGRFHALPVQAYAMYAPDLKANSAEAIIVVKDADNR